MADHTVSDQCIDATKRPFLSRRRLYGKIVIFLPKFCKMASQKLELYRVVHFNPWQLTRMAPERFRQAPDVGNRLGKMPRRHGKPRTLPIQEQLSKFCCLETTPHHPRHELGKVRHTDGYPPYFARTLAE